MPEKTAIITIDPAFTVGPVRRRTFGSFIEHLGRCVYTGIHDPDHASADDDGFRGDVIDATRELGISTVRYPGGNFVSGYRWEDGIGPIEQRPRRLDLAWHSTDPNTVGVDEFMRWAAKAGVEPMMAVNLGTRGVQEALDLLEYCNVKGGTHYADLRRQNGTADPYGVRMWCLGNEMDGPWQIGERTATEYGRLASRTAKAMRMVDPDLELVACGSSGRGMPTFGEWESTVLGHTYEDVDLISAHAYYAEEDGDLASFLASSTDMDAFIDSVVATADHVGARLKNPKKINISFDEWNVWYQSGEASKPPVNDWPVAPALLEDTYNVADAVVVGNLLISLLRRTDRVASASLAQLVNVIAPMMTEPGGRLWKQTTFHPFALTAQHAKGEVLHTLVSAPYQETAKFGETSVIDAVATHEPESGDYCVFIVNRSVTQELGVEVLVRGDADLHVAECLTLANPEDVHAASSVDDDTSLVPISNRSASLTNGSASVVVPPVSWTLLRLAPSL